ncbi:hypothetical protein [Pseudoneobacillus rhizosphaerae]|uniref:Uncharacterized protein n=1 Tax=Pseudoneobacillus rhizosphaerae TaxID=2880968 RepID=A0A9C7GBL4_9BACI|nr:hypothetical protein [Pseudoneobacillus rhizosphaerae]CAG9609444.1 hypothetical protein NEOCIP111885_03186 [Pseudoneobacillus rhizosphaerae]
MSEEERERLKAKELQKNPVGALNNAWTKAYTGSPSSGCLVNIISVVIVVGLLLLVRGCSS